MFKSWRDYWTFSREIMRERRFVRSDKAEAFLTAVAATIGERNLPIRKDFIAWRAQLGHDWEEDPQAGVEVPTPYSRQRMTPRKGRASEGRVNPKGVPCLYVATKKETAMSEVRPWIGSYVSVSQFRVLRDLRIVNCTLGHDRTPLFLAEPGNTKREQAVWAHIDRAFSEPVDRSDDTAEYAPTQVLAELFQSLGYDGVAYKSAFGTNGFNIALYDVESAKPVNGFLFKVKGIDIDFQEAANPYYVAE